MERRVAVLAALAFAGCGSGEGPSVGAYKAAVRAPLAAYQSSADAGAFADALARLDPPEIARGEHGTLVYDLRHHAASATIGKDINRLAQALDPG